jgi:CTP synthase (UTP-ammonia lyase)
MLVLNDFNTSVKKSLSEIDPKWEEYEGLVICGTHSPELYDIEHQINEIRDARENSMPYLGICFGHQLAAVEYARNVRGIKDAVSTEWGKGTPVVVKLPELKVGLHNGESYWHNYEVTIRWQNPEHFFTCQFHPEYQSTKKKPHPLLVSFLKYAKISMQNSK